jgi:hypothetical protein
MFMAPMMATAEADGVASKIIADASGSVHRSEPLVDFTEYYVALAQQDRDEFLLSDAEAVLVRERGTSLRPPHGPMRTMSMGAVSDEDIETVARSFETPRRYASTFQVHPLVKGGKSPFADMISVRRTGNNDEVLSDVSVSRFHLYFRNQEDNWLVCDAGSRNGTLLNGTLLKPNEKTPISSGAQLRIGDVSTVFFAPADLYGWLQNRPK